MASQEEYFTEEENREPTESFRPTDLPIIKNPSPFDFGNSSSESLKVLLNRPRQTHRLHLLLLYVPPSPTSVYLRKLARKKFSQHLPNLRGRSL